MNDSKTITNEILNAKLDLVLKILEQHDKRFEQIDARFAEFKEEISQRFEQIDKHFVEFKTEIKEEIKELKYDLRSDKEKLDKVYESRDQVTVKFSRAFAGVNILLAALVAFFVSMWR